MYFYFSLPCIVNSESLLSSYNLTASSNSIWVDNIQGSPKFVLKRVKH